MYALCFALLALLFASEGWAARVSIAVEGLEGEMEDAALAALTLGHYTEREVTATQIRRLFRGSDEQIRQALQPYGYYHSRVRSELEQPQADEFRAVFHVDLGEPVVVHAARIEIRGAARDLPEVQAALEMFEPKVGQRLDHGAYESSKSQIDTTLRSAGYLQAEMVEHRVAVTASANTAEIDLAWDPKERFRFGEVRFSEAQFPETFLQRFVPWTPGEFYTTERLLELQQRLVDADYFASVAVTPNLEQARDGAVPLDVLLIPAKRTVYTAAAYVSTDSGPGARLGAERRWLNRRGHKLGGEIEYSQRLEEISANYRIPQPGVRSRNYNFGAAYRDEETDTSRSRMARLAATQVEDRWKGFTRTLGLQYLNGDFEIADEQQSTSLLYAEGLLQRKRADDLYFPVSGYSLLYGVRLAAETLFSDTSLAQIRAEAKWLQQVGEDGRVILRAALGAMAVDDFDSLPPELRFFAGGDRSIRGFDYQQIGETDAEGDVIGGEFLAAGSAEYEHYFLENWGLAAFVDAGDAFSSDFDANVGAGMGLRWKSPVGLVRLDVARPVVTELEDSWRIHIVIGPDL